ncbi:hypothetical protein OAD66_01805 [Bacteroidia bacterium]|nr:hypothetical protein [Bacteroidia bacterium]
MPSYVKKILTRLEKEDFSYSKPVSRQSCFKDGMCDNFPKIQDLILYLQSEWEQAKSGAEYISTYIIDRGDAAGIVIKVGEQKNLDLQHYLLDYIKDQILSHGYQLSVNKHCTARTCGCCEEYWHYFLKPKPQSEDGKRVQLYGNVIVELRKDTKLGVQFKLQCNYFSGFNYQVPNNFAELLQIL